VLDLTPGVHSAATMSRRSTGSSEGGRLLRLEQLLLEELHALFADELGDPRLSGVRVLAVALSPDYRHARVHCIPPQIGTSRDEVLRALERANAFLRRRVADALELKRTPELHFVVDAAIVPVP